MRHRARIASLLTLTTLFLFVGDSAARAVIIVMHSGFEVEGAAGNISGVASRTPPGGQEAGVNLVVLLDDQLRRVFLPQHQVFDTRNSIGRPPEQIAIDQPPVVQGTTAAGRLSSVGPIIAIQPFDRYGRRTVTMNSNDGAIDLVQGITMVTPTWTRVETLQGGRALEWETYIATSSIPRDTLSEIMLEHSVIDPTDPDDRLKIVRLYVQAGRARDAQIELAGILEDFADLTDVQDLEDQVRELRDMSARRLLAEIDLRRESGQHALAVNMLQGFPDEDVAGQVLIEVSDKVKEYDRLLGDIYRVNEQLQDMLNGLDDARLQQQLTPIVDEIAAELSVNTHDRTAAFRRLADDDQLDPEQKIALAISGWLIGSNDATENIAIATSLYEVRGLLLSYINSDTANQRAQILEALTGQEGATPGYIALLAAHMKPPVETPGVAELNAPADDNADDDTASDIVEDADDDAPPEPPGFFKLSVPGTAGLANFDYYVQLPPEYDPYRKYPTIVTLNGLGTTPEQQIDWWAGGFSPQLNMRLGQGTRHGYIVIAPVWRTNHQRDYEYSGREHAAVLYTLRDACRRFSIDTDRVFLSGHSLGGEAAWDIGLAHPDLWAGVIPIVARGEKYITRYWPNAELVPFYFVGGELDSDWLGDNRVDFDRYLTRTGFDTVVVAYQGRGHEHFIDEIQNLFSWMDKHERNFFPKEFECLTMREWDNFFFWIELEDLPTAAIVPPAAWEQTTGARPAETEAKIPTENSIMVTSPADRVTIYLTPDLVDFNQPITIRVGSRRNRETVTPSNQDILEDLRTRGDRQRPFWAQLIYEHGRLVE